MGLVYNQKVDLLIEEISMPFLDRGSLQILKRKKDDNLLPLLA